MYGIENIGVNPEYAKNVTKVGFLNTSSNNTPLSIHIINNKKIFTKHIKHYVMINLQFKAWIDNICVPIDKNSKNWN